MKERGGFRRLGRLVTRTIINDRVLRAVNKYKWCAAILTAFAAALSAHGQAPALAWTSNVGATLFAVDTNGNLYATTNGAVIVLNSSGAVIQSNNICPLPGIAQRDSAGNYYFAGSFAGTQNFGGVTLVGGFVFENNPPDTNFPTCYLAKYTSTGSLIWVVPFGQYSYRNRVDDMAVNPDDSVTIGFDDSATYSNGYLIRFDTSGTNLWQTNITSGQLAEGIKVTGLAGTNGCFLLYGSISVSSGVILGGFYDPAGKQSLFSQTPPPAPLHHSSLSENGKPVPGTNNDAYMACVNFYYPSNQTNIPVLTDCQAGDVILSTAPIGPVEQWAVGGGNGQVYLAGTNGIFSKYLGDGTLVWTTNYGPPVAIMLLDASGNRYISRIDGSIARLGVDATPAPSIMNAPVGGTIFFGSNFTFSVGASGYAPLGYRWYYQSNPTAAATAVPGATNSTLTIIDAGAAQSGLYSVLITNNSGSITSTPVTLQVKLVELYNGSEMLSGGSYTFSSFPTLTIQSAFPSGEIYYTLDGSTPTFLSTQYTAPFVLSNNATINAIGYSSDFSQSALADTVVATVPPQYTLSVSTPGGGSITVSPPGGSFTNASFSYESNTIVTATAVPAAGFSLLGWQGAASGNNPTVSVTMNQSKSLTAVFGTTLSTTVAGNGQVLLAPPGGVYGYGTTVRLEALPQSGNFFGAWGNAASGSSNPLYFTVTNPTPTVSSVFAPTPSNEAALTVLIFGQGTIGKNPAGNVFPTNQSVTLTATPAGGQSFVHWSGDISSTNNPVTVPMTQSRVINAVFTGRSAALATEAPGAPYGMTPGGFNFAVMGDPQSVYQIQSSTDLVHWSNLMLLTNSTGEAPVLDPAATNLPYIFYRAVLMMP